MKRFLLILSILSYTTLILKAQQPYLVKDIKPGSEGSILTFGTFNDQTFPMVSFNQALIFIADDGIHGLELWRSNGTSNGTYMIQDINPGSEGSEISGFFEFNGFLYFSANDGTNGKELWRTDGTDSGTQLYVDINPGSVSSNPAIFTIIGNNLYLAATEAATQRELWISDGSVDGTKLFIDLNSFGSGNPRAVLPTSTGGFFLLAGSSFQYDLWFCTGSADEITLIREEAVYSSEVKEMIVYNDILYFSGYMGSFNEEPWISDGTANGTVLLKEIEPGSSSSNPVFFTAFKNKIYFEATNDIWETNGTPEGTVKFSNLDLSTSQSTPNNMMIFNDILYFPATNEQFGTGPGFELYRTNGSGTNLVKDIYEGLTSSNPEELTVFNNKLYFSALGEDIGRELYVTDGSGPGTILLADINDGNTGSIPKDLTPVDNLLFFSVDDGINGREIWALDATSGVKPNLERTQSLFSLYPNPAKNQLNINFKNNGLPAGVELINISGQIVKTITPEALETIITLEGINSGTYLVRAWNDNEIQYSKLVIER